MQPPITDEERREAYGYLCTSWGQLAPMHADALRDAPPSWAEFTEDLCVADSYVVFMRLARGT